MKDIYYLFALIILLASMVWRESSWRTIVKNDLKHLESRLIALEKQVAGLITRFIEKGISN